MNDTAADADTVFADPGPDALPWSVRLFCCGRPDGTAQLKTRGEAHVLRSQYLSADGHKRAAIITGPAGELEQSPVVVLAEYLEALGADRGLKVVVDECLGLLRTIAERYAVAVSQRDTLKAGFDEAVGEAAALRERIAEGCERMAAFYGDTRIWPEDSESHDAVSARAMEHGYAIVANVLRGGGIPGAGIRTVNHTPADAPQTPNGGPQSDAGARMGYAAGHLPSEGADVPQRPSGDVEEEPHRLTVRLVPHRDLSGEDLGPQPLLELHHTEACDRLKYGQICPFDSFEGPGGADDRPTEPGEYLGWYWSSKSWGDSGWEYDGGIDWQRAEDVAAQTGGGE